VQMSYLVEVDINFSSFIQAVRKGMYLSKTLNSKAR